MKNPFGWHYPPGCSEADIERAFGDKPEQKEEEPDPDLAREDLEERREMEKAYYDSLGAE
jgi:hypothetical protein